MFEKRLRLGSNALLHMRRTQFSLLGPCEFRRLIQLNSPDFIWSGWGFFHAWHAWRPTLGQTLKSTWKTAFVVCLVWQFRLNWIKFNWIKFDVWLRQAFSIIWADTNCHLVRLMWSTAFDPGLRYITLLYNYLIHCALLAENLDTTSN